MSYKSLKETFNRVVSKLIFWDRPSLPYGRVVNLFDLRNERFTTEPRNFWAPGNFKGLPTLYPISGGEPVRVFYADPNKKIKLQRRSAEDSIYGNPQTIEINASASIVATEYEKNSTDRMLTVMIFDEISNPERPFDFLAFGLYGERKKDGYIQFKTILVPAIDVNGKVTGIRNVNLRNETDITAALAYGKTIAAQVMAGQSLTPGATMAEIKSRELDAKRLPWKKPPAP